MKISRRIVSVIIILINIALICIPTTFVQAVYPFVFKDINGHVLKEGSSVSYEKCPIKIIITSKDVSGFTVEFPREKSQTAGSSDKRLTFTLTNNPLEYRTFIVKKDGQIIYTVGFNFYHYITAKDKALTYRTTRALVETIDEKDILDGNSLIKTKDGRVGLEVLYDFDNGGVDIDNLLIEYKKQTGISLSPGPHKLKGYLKVTTYRYGVPDKEYWTNPYPPHSNALYDLGWTPGTLNDFRTRATWQATVVIEIDTGSIEAKLRETSHNPKDITYTIGDINPDGNVTVNLDASQSTAKLNCVGSCPCNATGFDTSTSSGLITNYRFWVSTNKKELEDVIKKGLNTEKGYPSTTATKSITVHNVKPESTIYCLVRAYSKELLDHDVSENKDLSDIIEIPIGKNAVTPPPPPPGYKSAPTVYSELKEGAPLAENFEAMAGVPTNKHLYFAAGGSEFIVDLELQYMQNQTATRTYTSIFTGNIPCELNGSVTCPRPCGGHQVPAGTDSEGHTTYRTEYRPGDDCACPSILHSEHNLHYVGGHSDTWTQTVKFDYMKITNLKLWKIDKANLSGMSLIKADGSDGVTATIAQGDPTYFCNIPQSDTSAAGRLRYSLEPQQHDNVVWNEGPSDNQHSNSKTSGAVNEQAKFTERRNMTTNVTVMSDCLILQTSSGDQSILYFQKTSNTARTTEQLTVTATKEEMWDNNPLSAKGQAYSENSIKIGSYNGNYRNPSVKYNAGGGSQVSTIFDGALALGISRPARPSGGLRLVKDGIDILDTAPNGAYSVGYADVFYKLEKNYTAQGFTPTAAEYDVTAQPDFGNVPGHVVYNAPYSPDHPSINSIIIHNPVSTEYAGVISLPASRDQRTAATPGMAGALNGEGDVCPRDSLLCEYRTLNCHYTGGTQHAAACYTGVNVQGPNNAHVHTAACSKSTQDVYLCGITPVPTYYYNWYHTDCGALMNYGPSPDYCSCCGSYGRAQGEATIVWNHVHTATCGVIPAGTWSCNNLPLNAHVHGPNCGCISRLELNCTEPHHLGLHYDEPGRTCYVACNNDANHKNKKVLNPGGGTGYSVGNFINIDYAFQIYFPNRGDFSGDGSYGLGYLNSNRGKGYTDNMDTTPYTAAKRVKFEFPAIYNGVLYEPLSWIDLPINSNDPSDPGRYDFYCPLAAYETAGAKIYYEVYANNNPDYYRDNESLKNHVRDSGFQAKHSAYKLSYADVVGRIGNLTIEDTGDFRFSNFFKTPQNPTEWVVNNLVKKVDNTQQFNYMAYSTDIRGENISASTKWLNTYGLFPWLEKSPSWLPLSPDRNYEKALKKQPLRLGYDVFADISTLGNYYTTLQIIPYYYYLDLSDGRIYPVDIYMEQNGSYKLINKFDIVKPGWDSSGITPFNYNLNWDYEKARRNFKASEEAATNTVCSNRTLKVQDASGNWIDGQLSIPSGSSYNIGTAQLITLGQKARTFIGNTRTYEQDKNPGNVLSSIQYEMQAQRWHFTLGLPSSAFAVKQNKTPNEANINEIRKSNGVLLLAAAIKSAGTVYNLEYKHLNGNGSITFPTISGHPVSYSMESDVNSNAIPPVLCIFSANKSSADDLQITGTH